MSRLDERIRIHGTTPIPGAGAEVANSPTQTGEQEFQNLSQRSQPEGGGPTPFIDLHKAEASNTRAKQLTPEVVWDAPKVMEFRGYVAQIEYTYLSYRYPDKMIRCRASRFHERCHLRLHVPVPEREYIEATF